MKKIIPSLILIQATILTSIVCKGGTPDQDPVVAHLRTRFATADVPSENDLKINTEIACTEFMAIKDDYSSQSIRFLFRKIDGVFISDGDTKVKTYAFHPTMGFVGAWSDSAQRQYYSVLRIAANGDLIQEWFMFPNDFQLAPSLVLREYGVISYAVCPKENSTP